MTTHPGYFCSEKRNSKREDAERRRKDSGECCRKKRFVRKGIFTFHQVIENLWPCVQIGSEMHLILEITVGLSQYRT